MSMVLESVDRSQRFPLDRESIFVGSSEWKSDICLTGPDIADVHCELTPEAHGVRVVALADGEVTVNGVAIREGTLLTGDELGIASLRFRVTSEEALAPSTAEIVDVAEISSKPVAPQSCRWLVSMSGMKLGPLDWDELQTMIGRGELRLDDEIQRENESTWQCVREVLPRSGGEGLLCDELPTDEVTPPPRRIRKRRTSQQDRHSSDEFSPYSPDGSDNAHASVVEPVLLVVPLPPQFFILRSGEEVGPLPRQSIQELADAGTIHADTPVRLEESTEWSTAVAVGFHCSATAPPDGRAVKAAIHTERKVDSGFAWLAFAPYYFVTGLARSAVSISRRRMVIGGAIVLVIGVVASGWFRSWSQTAMRGVISLDGQPVAEVLVQLTGASTGDSAIGVSGSDGSFRVVTLDGELKPGLYLVTVRPLSEISGNRISNTTTTDTSQVESNLPERYRHLNTTDATIEITTDQSHYSVVLTKQPRSTSAGFGGRAVSAAHALQ